MVTLGMVGMGGTGAMQQIPQPTRQTEISQAIEELAKVNSILLEKLSCLGDRLSPIRTAKAVNTAPGGEKDSRQPCQLASAIRQRACEVAQGVDQINTILNEIEL
jgi:hypothetical protein